MPTNQPEQVVFIDECGNTGEDLANEDQPVFCLGSICLSEQECTEIKKEYFCDVQATELKHTSLSSGSRNRQRVLAFVKGLSSKADKVKFSVAHKKYVLVSKMIDLIIEPLAYEDGVDFYEKGANIAYPNLMYNCILGVKGEPYFSSLLRRFQQAVRGKTQKTYDEFMNIVTDDDIEEIIKQFFSSFIYSDMKHGSKAFLELPSKPLDISFSVALSLVVKWSSELSGNFTVIHDQSAVMSKNKKIWDRIVSPDVQSALVGQDIRTIQFPLCVNATGLHNSCGSNGLQLADVLAGAMARSLTWKINGEEPSDKYGAELSEIFADRFDTVAIWPSLAVTPEELGTTGIKHADIIDHFIGLTEDLLPDRS